MEVDQKTSSIKIDKTKIEEMPGNEQIDANRIKTAISLLQNKIQWVIKNQNKDKRGSNDLLKQKKMRLVNLAKSPQTLNSIYLEEMNRERDKSRKPKIMRKNLINNSSRNNTLNWLSNFTANMDDSSWSSDEKSENKSRRRRKTPQAPQMSRSSKVRSTNWIKTRIMQRIKKSMSTKGRRMFENNSRATRRNSPDSTFFRIKQSEKSETKPSTDWQENGSKFGENESKVIKKKLKVKPVKIIRKRNLKTVRAKSRGNNLRYVSPFAKTSLM